MSKCNRLCACDIKEVMRYVVQMEDDNNNVYIDACLCCTHITDSVMANLQ